MTDSSVQARLQRINALLKQHHTSGILHQLSAADRRELDHLVRILEEHAGDDPEQIVELPVAETLLDRHERIMLLLRADEFEFDDEEVEDD